MKGTEKTKKLPLYVELVIYVTIAVCALPLCYVAKGVGIVSRLVYTGWECGWKFGDRVSQIREEL